ISAVGHEPDVTISDFVADARASTPSNAAEIAVPDEMELRRALRDLEERMNQSELQRLKLLRRRVETLAEKRVLQDATAYLQDQRMRLDHLQQRLGDVTANRLQRKKQKFTALTASLDAMSPLKVLGRGYAMALNSSGEVIRSPADTEKGESIYVRLGRGALECTVDFCREETT
ncbi:MAG: exodeoxyribonuclease VII large subunit, partial [Oscillibacter sp.]|nr:exodeoxyribonuclease VII large subunit [Oscillibacter sp.]